MQADLITKTCPICWETFSPAGRQARHRIYCSKRRKSTAASRRERGELVPHTRTASQAGPFAERHQKLGCGSQVRADFEDPALRPGGQYSLKVNDHIEGELEPMPFDGVWTAYLLAR